jgi:hypothetical protein
MRSNDQRFIEALTGVAELTQMTLTPNIVNLYAKAVEPYGYGAAADALCALAVNCRPGYGFPTIKELLKEIDPKKHADVDPEGEASLVASLIAGAVARKGYTCKPDALLEAIGPLGIEVVRISGGWARICEEMTPDNTPTYKAQWRREALAILNRRKAGYEGLPGLPDVVTKRLPPETQLMLERMPDKLSLNERK